MNISAASTVFFTLAIATSLAACSVPQAPQEIGFGGFDGAGGVKSGTIEDVRAVRIERDIHAYEQNHDLRIQPEVRDELLIRLDNGRALKLMAKSTQRFEPGERVRVLSDNYSPFAPRIEHE